MGSHAVSHERVTLVNRVAVPVEAPARVLVIPWGEVASKSRDMVVDEESARAVIEAFAAHGVDLPIDYEHQTLGGEYASPDGTAPAAAWIKSLQPEPGVGIWANVEWTQRGAELVRAKEYRYLSPVAMVRKSDGKVMALQSVALTNTPAIVGMQPVVNKESDMDQSKFDSARWFLNLEALATNEEIAMKMEEFVAQMRAELGLANNATAEQVTSSIKALKAASGTRVAVCTALKLDAAAKDDDIVAAINKAQQPATPANPGATEEVKALQETLKVVNTELSVVKAENAARRAGERIAEAIAVGKLDDRMLAVNSATGKNYYRQLAEGDQWDLWFASAPVIAPPNGRVVNNERGAASGGQGRKAAEFEKLVAEKVTNSGGKLPRHEAWAAVCKERPDLREGLNEPVAAI